MGTGYRPLTVSIIMGLLLIAGGHFFARMDPAALIIGSAFITWVIVCAVVAHYTERGGTHVYRTTD